MTSVQNLWNQAAQTPKKIHPIKNKWGAADTTAVRDGDATAAAAPAVGGLDVRGGPQPTGSLRYYKVWLRRETDEEVGRNRIATAVEGRAPKDASRFGEQQS